MIIIKRGDIILESVDAIVNAANSSLRGGGGVDGAIHRAAGPSVMTECRAIGGCRTGNAVMTRAGNLHAKKILHAVGPVWRGGAHHEAELLKRCYLRCFELARGEGFSSIAFPAISTGVYQYPLEEATRIALMAGIQYENDFKEIRFICFSDADLSVYQRIFTQLKNRTGNLQS